MAVLQRTRTAARSPKFGKGEHVIASSALTLTSDLEARLRACFASDDYAPPHLPRAATEILALSQRADMELDDVVTLLEEDGMLAGRVLKIAASPAYSGGARLTSLRQAVVRLGMNNLRDVVFEVAMRMKVFRAPGLEGLLDQVWRHCRTTAYLSRTVCRYAALDAELAFLCGLLHDIGAAGAILLLAQEDGVKPGGQATLEAIAAVHVQAGETMAKRWGLDFDIHHTVGHHHGLQDPIHPMAAVVCLAESLAAGLGHNMPTMFDAGSSNDAGRARESLGFNDETFEQLHKECEAQLGSLV